MEKLDDFFQQSLECCNMILHDLLSKLESTPDSLIPQLASLEDAAKVQKDRKKRIQDLAASLIS